MNNESARSMRFGIAMQELLGIQPNFVESYISGVEKYLKVKQKDRILKGKADNFFGNIVIEFEANIPKKLDEAKEQLQRYIAILWSQEPIDNRTLYIGIATDGGAGNIKSIGKLRSMVRNMLKRSYQKYMY
ncbi:MAG: hypothetical protein QG641_1115 [Candidatus Poribacteria bacterium]|nr:hypothetical protein [Candidatus Poribacteria bacterium]